MNRSDYWILATIPIILASVGLGILLNLIYGRQPDRDANRSGPDPAR